MMHLHTNYICNQPKKTVREFEGWKHVPPDLKTRSQWLRAGGRVPKDAAPVAKVVYPKVVEGVGIFDRDTVVLAQWDDGAVISHDSTYLFDLDQTFPYSPTPRTRAYWAFEEMFFKYARKDCWIHKTDLRTDEERDDWITESELAYAAYRDRNRLTDNLIRKHVNQRQIIGVKGDRLTRFVVIDLDFHGRNLNVFEAQAEVLLDRFHGVGTWHYQVKKEDVTGLQLICVFDEPKELAVVQKELRASLVDLDAQNPELAAEAKSAGMKSLAELEIYPSQHRHSDDDELETPDNGNGVRLPLCRGRVMLLDKPLELVRHQKKLVQDVEGYIRWLQDPDRQSMPKDRILDYLHYFACDIGSPTTTTTTTKPKKTQGKAIDHRRWRGNLRRWLYEFWVEGNANGRPLNEHIMVLARLAAVQGHSEQVITERIMALVRALPSCAKSCSSRLLKGEYKKIDNVVSYSAKYACGGNGHQRDARNSNDIFSAALLHWPDFDPLDTSTWHAPKAKVALTPNWTDQQRRRLCAFFRKPLFVKDDDLVIRFINGIVNLTVAKEREGSGWGKEYLLKWINDNFPQIKCAKDEKRQRIMRCLEEEGIIQVIARGRAGMYATHWTLGKEARLALGVTDHEPERECAARKLAADACPGKRDKHHVPVLLKQDQEQSYSLSLKEAPNGPYDTSIYYSSLFSNIGFSEQLPADESEQSISILLNDDGLRRHDEMMEAGTAGRRPVITCEKPVIKTGCQQA